MSPTAPVAPAPERPGLVRTWWAPASIAAGLSGAVAYIATHDPHTQSIFPPCTILSLTGWTCPGCGGTRAVHDLVHLDVASALHMNAFVVLVAIPVALGLFAWWCGVLAGIWRRPGEISPRWAWYFLAAMAAFTVIRNLPPLSPYLNP